MAFQRLQTLRRNVYPTNLPNFIEIAGRGFADSLL